MTGKWQDALWRKSTHSDSGGCVEVACVDGIVGVRDTKANGAGPVLEFNRKEWNAFLQGVAAGEFTMEALNK
ncbi:MAG: DUF397 domain-containing protein [Acidimicrobiaceae bacterium]|nr:DUF397 domain-containing protein [Acidimicrobiaceae bacterium]